jgi:ketosteroid isomerase-like protein
MTFTAPTPARAAFERQLAAMARGDLDAVLENYAPDAALLRFDGLFSGTDRIREAFSAYLALEPQVLELCQYAEHDGTICYRAIMVIGGERKEAVGTMVLKDGMIWRQTAVVCNV